jgi:DNA-binding NarL/FixJ family response regulator
MYSLGANGYLNKTASDSEILKAVNSVINGINYVSDKFIQKMTDDLINKRSSNPFEKLSKREFEITILLIKGFSMNKISEIMNLHSSTVGTYKAKVFEKIGVDNVIDLKEIAELFSISAI